MSTDSRPIKADTHLTHAGCDPAANHGIVNPPVYHASTVLFPTVAALEERTRTPLEGVYYGRHGTPTSFAFEKAVAGLEGGFNAVSLPSGQSALTTALLSVTRAGDHILMTDSVYAPTRNFCETLLHQFGVETEYFDPGIGDGIGSLVRPNTTAVYLESPGSVTFEIQDVPAIATAARAAATAGRQVHILIDNTWATPLFLKPFGLGATISIHAATKYIAGHSDAMLGVIVCDTEETWLQVKRTAVRLGGCAGPDDVYLGLRGLRTMSVRLARHQETGLRLAAWFAERPEVARVIHPARPDHPNHALWARDFTGASGLFAIVLNPVPKPALAAMLDGLRFFGMGYSWGGFESLILPSYPKAIRTATQWIETGQLLRVHAGLEDPNDLLIDLDEGFARLHAAL